MSVKTARRDLEALAIAGIPVYSQAGKNGGWSLVGGARTDLSGLTADEARALFLLAGPSAALTPDAKAALRKLVSALPETFRSAAEAAAAAIVLDPADVGRPPTRAAGPPRRAPAGGRSTGGRCASATPTAPAPRPSGPSIRSVWSRRARCGTSSPGRRQGCARSGSAGCSRSRSRTSRWSDRPTSISPRRGRRSWRRSRNGGPRCGPSCASTRSRSRGSGPSSGPHSRVGDELADGRVEVEIGARYPNRIAEQLAGWGDLVEVVSPPEVREPPRADRQPARRRYA